MPIIRYLKKAKQYQPIKDYFLIGNLHTAALVSKDGAIDWLCLPHFDSSSIFGRLLDSAKGGTFAIDAPGYKTESHYIGDTAILGIIFKKGKKRFKVHDFMVPMPRKHTQAHFLVRKIFASSHDVTVHFLFDPRPDYGRDQPMVICRSRSLQFKILIGDKPDTVRLHLPVGATTKQLARGWAIDVFVPAGESRELVLEHTKAPRSQYKEQDLESPTVSFWRRWVDQGTFFDFCRNELVRSAITLKLMQFYPTGAIVASPTTSLPEKIGGVRNWDYRYVWIRDATFVLYALYVLGYTNEAERFFRFIEKVTAGSQEHAVELHLFYTIWGDRVPRESTLEHLEGYARSAPVRVGNDATDQFQLDIYGSLIDAHYFMSTRGLSVTKASRSLIIELTNKIAERWKEQDNGIWEFRSGARHFTYSKVMAWVGVNRSLRMAKRLRITEAKKEEWRILEDKIYKWIMKNCFDKKRNTFKQHSKTDRQDAVNFFIPILQFFKRDDPRAKSVIEQTCSELRYREVFIYRYIAEDGLPRGEGTFVLCSFWYISALAYVGKIRIAMKLFNKFSAYIAPSGLMSEEINLKNRRYLGNFPQGFSHIGYIMSAYYIHRYGHEKYGHRKHPRGHGRWRFRGK